MVNTRTFNVTTSEAMSSSVTDRRIYPHQGTKISTEAGALLIWGPNPSARERDLISQVVTMIYAPGTWLYAEEENGNG